MDNGRPEKAAFLLCAEHDQQLGGKSRLPSLMEAKGQRSWRSAREVGSEGSAEQTPRADEQKPDRRPTVAGELKT
jgi:hypothetical protein